MNFEASLAITTITTWQSNGISYALTKLRLNILIPRPDTGLLVLCLPDRRVSIRLSTTCSRSPSFTAHSSEVLVNKMRPILSSCTVITLVSLTWAGHAVTNSQSPGLKELYARYEANFESQSICYTYITTITVPLESLSSLSPQGVPENVTSPAAISLPPSSFEVAPGSSLVHGLGSLALTPTQSLEHEGPSGLLTSAAGLSPGPNAPQSPSPGQTGPSDANGSASRGDLSTMTDPALTYPRSDASASTGYLPDPPNSSLGSEVNLSGDVSSSTEFLSDTPNPGSRSAITAGSDIPVSTGFLSETPTPSLGSAVTPGSDVSDSSGFPQATIVSDSLPLSPPLSLPSSVPDSLGKSGSGQTELPSSLLLESGVSQVTELPPATQVSDGETTTGVSATNPTFLSGANPTLTGPSVGATGAVPTAAGTTSLAGGISSGLLDSGSSTMTIFSDSGTGATGLSPGPGVSSQGSNPKSSLPSITTPPESVTDAESLTATSSTSDASPSAASRVILSVRSELPPALAPTITITEEATSSQAPPRLVRRQAEPDNSTAGFIGNYKLPNPNSCSNARLFVRSSGALQSEGEPLSVDPGIPYIDIANHSRGSVTTRFDVVNGTLVWINPFFYGGQAGFCQINGSSVYATFTKAGGPKDCMDVNLVVYRGTLSTTYLSGLENTN